jgi:hypothetical protein
MIQSKKSLQQVCAGKSCAELTADSRHRALLFQIRRIPIHCLALPAASSSAVTGAGAGVVGRSVGFALVPGLRASIATNTAISTNQTQKPKASASGIVMIQPTITSQQECWPGVPLLTSLWLSHNALPLLATQFLGVAI